MMHLMIISCLVACVTCSHFRGGIISLSPIDTENKTMEITFRVSYRRNHIFAAKCNEQIVEGGKEVGGHPKDQGIFCVSGCEKKPLVSLIRYVCTDYSTTDNWEYGERTLRYSFKNVTMIRLSATGCCWVAPFGSGKWDLFSVIDLTPRADTGRINSSPQARFFPVIPIQRGCNSSIAIRPYDPDGDVVRCRWGIGAAECSGICNGFPGALLDEETCTLSYQSKGRDRGFKAVALMMEDFAKTDTGFAKPLSTIALNFLVNIYISPLNCTGALPEYASPTPADESCIAIPPGSTYNAQIVVDTRSSTVSVSEVKTVGPVGVDKSALTAIPASTLTAVNISWIPQTSDYYQNNNRIETICFTGVASSGQSTAERCIQWMAGVQPPRVVPNSITPRDTKISPENPEFIMMFDQPIRRSARAGKFIIRDLFLNLDVYSISFGAEHSGETITIENNNEIMVYSNYRFVEKRNYSIVVEAGFVEGTVGCGPQSESFAKNQWMFETLDITPPRIFFNFAPKRSNRSIYIAWSSNEPLGSSSCKILTNTGDQLSQYQCSGDSWTGFQLQEGKYTISITATDLAGNMVTRLHNWEVDLTPPDVQVLAPFTGESSNLKDVRFRLTCPGKPTCTYTCVLISNINEYTQLDCRNGIITIQGLTQEAKYQLIVSAVDDVGNKGQNFTYSWDFDLTAPSIGNMINEVGTCYSDLSPTTLSQPTVTDNVDRKPKLTYSDNGNRGDCEITRIWKAKDSAGNSHTAEQIITLTFTPMINHLPQLRLPCDPEETIKVPTQTANADNNCTRKVTLAYTDSVSSPSCPSQLERTWTATDSCDTSNTPIVKTQIISFYSICPPSACGRNNQPPHGTCIEGRCLCYKPYAGEDCDVVVYAPKILPIKDKITLKENELYEQNMEILKGTMPVYFELETGPETMRINQLTGIITWQADVVTEVPVTVKAINGVGMDRASWNISVTPGYTPKLDPLSQTVYPTAKPITLSGLVKYQTGNLIETKFEGQVPVDIYVMVSGTTRKFQTVSRPDRSFSFQFEPLRLEYGKYKAVASHPGRSSGLSELQWDILGMKLTLPVIAIEDQFTIQRVEKLYLNYTELVNDGPASLTDVQVSYMQNIPNDVTIDVLFGQDKTISEFKPGDRVPINIKMSFSNPFGSIRAFFRIRSSEGVFVNLILNGVISLAQPSFSVQPKTLSESIARGTQKLVQFKITNTGHADASEVVVNIPNVKYISVVSFGVSNYATDKQEMQIGQSLVLVLRLTADQNSKLGRFVGKIGIESKEVQDSFGLDLKIISNKKAIVTFRVEDEFTYFAEGGPLVGNAKIRIYNNVRGITLTNTTELEKGMATFTNVPEATYEVNIEAPRHKGMKAVYLFKPGSSTIRIFLQRTAVAYRWTVTPTHVQDVYRIQVEADFETRVPMPVVTVTPISLDLEQFELGFRDAFELNVTNHGLIRAEEFEFAFPMNHPTLEFKPLATFEGLEARTSQIIPVKVLQKSIRRRKRATCGGYSVTIQYGYECGQWVIRQTSVTLYVPPRECTTWKPRGRAHGGYVRYRGVASGSGRSACDPCLQAFFNCLISFTPLGPLPCILTGAFGAINAANNNAKASDFNDFALCATKAVVGTVFKPLALPINVYDCIVGIGLACHPPPGATSSGGGVRRKRDVRTQLIQLFAKAAKPVSAMVEWRLEVYGKQVWQTVDDEVWFTELFISATSDDSQLGEAITRQEYDSIMNKAQPEGVTKNDVSDFLMRWNNTVFDWTNGRLEPTEAEPNRMSYSKVQKLKSEIRKGQEDAVSAGFESFIDWYNDQVESMNQIDNWDEEKGVCAVVRVRIEQELTLTREGFNAKLEIDNGEISTLTEIDVKISIRDAETGEYSTDLFSIGNATTAGAITSGRSLSMQQSGELTWLIIPYSEAAPNNEKYYDVGGTLYYKVDSVLITVPLLPARITVQPDPSLLVHYFWEKFVISDDPFTDKVERAVPFSLAVVVRNDGNGTAQNLRITSSQPEIIENEKGLLVTFKMIGANVGNNNVTPSLSVDFGDIIPDRTAVASWWMVSSLRGQFQNYSATFENENPLGDPRLSLIDDLQVHELIRRVSLVKGDIDDQIADFLVNEVVDFNIYPDAVYSSASLTRYNVSVHNISLSTAVTFGVGHQFLLTAMPSTQGYVYYRFETDVQVTELISVSSLSFERNVTTKQDKLPSENAWFTAMIGERESDVLIGHMFDYITDPGLVHHYNLFYSIRELQESTVVLRPTQAPMEVELQSDVIVGRVTLPPRTSTSSTIFGSLLLISSYLFLLMSFGIFI